MYHAASRQGCRRYTEFATVAEYTTFIEEIRQRLNRKVAKRFEEERHHLRPLPTCRIPEYTDVTMTVRKWSTIRVCENTYSVPSNLIGHHVKARVHPDVVEVLYGDRVVERFPRLRGRGQQRIDYHHIIHSLVRKPGAFARYHYREELFPTLTFRFAYDDLRRRRGERAEVEYVRILHLAATTSESEVETGLQLLMESGRGFDFADVKSLVDISPRPKRVHLAPGVPNLHQYDEHLKGGYRAHAQTEARALAG